MARKLENRKIYGIQLQSNEHTGLRQMFLNFGENKYGYCTMEEFFQYVKTWKFAKQEAGKKTTFVPFEEYKPSGRFGDLIELFEFVKEFVEIKF